LPIVDCTESIYISRNYWPIPRQPRITKTRYPILAERMLQETIGVMVGYALRGLKQKKETKESFVQ
jgi:hypothetical protein